MASIVVADSAAMTPTSLTRLAGVLGGLCWVVRAVLDDGDGPESLINGLHYGGLALLVIALLGIGGGLVSGLAALRVVVAVCLVALAWAVLEFLHHEYADRGVDGVLGALMALYCLGGLLRRRRRPQPEAEPRPHGSHAA
jgi:DMSO/TMAO reductase YedYZ heme-binding membrane subunit